MDDDELARMREPPLWLDEAPFRTAAGVGRGPTSRASRTHPHSRDALAQPMSGSMHCRMLGLANRHNGDMSSTAEVRPSKDWRGVLFSWSLWFPAEWRCC